MSTKPLLTLVNVLERLILDIFIKLFKKDLNIKNI